MSTHVHLGTVNDQVANATLSWIQSNIISSAIKVPAKAWE